MSKQLYIYMQQDAKQRFWRQSLWLLCFTTALLLALLFGLPRCGYALVKQVEVNSIVEKAINHHPVVLAAKSEAEATDEGVVAAKLGRFPALTIDSGLSTDGLTSVISVEQPLWTGGRLDATIDQANYDTYAARANAELERYNIALKTIDAWQAFAQSSNLKKVYRLNLGELNRFEQMMSRRVRADVSARIELDLVMNRLLQSQDSLQGAVEQQRIALSRIEQLVGEPVSREVLNSSYPLGRLAIMVRQQSSSLRESVIEAASGQHPSVIKTAYEMRAAEASAEVEKAKQWPQLYARYRHQYTHSNKTGDDVLSVGLQYAPGAGFSSFSFARAAAARAQSTRYSQEAARRQVVEDLQVEYQKFASNRDRERALVAAVDGSKIVKASYERQFIAGRKSWLDVLNVVRETEQYEVELVQVRVAMIASFYRLKLGIGLLPWQKSQ